MNDTQHATTVLPCLQAMTYGNLNRMKWKPIQDGSQCSVNLNTVLCPAHTTPPGEKWSGQLCQISWAYSGKVVRTNKISRLVIITLHSLTTVKFTSLLKYPYLFRAGLAQTLLGDMITKVCASPRNLIWFARLFLLVRRWGVGMRLI